METAAPARLRGSWFLLALAMLLAGTAVVRATDWAHSGSDGDRSRRTSEDFPAPPPGALVPLWTNSFGVAARGGIAVSDGLVFFGADDGKVRAFREGDGTATWEQGISAYPIYSTPAALEGRLYVAVRDGFVYCLREADGVVLWRHATGGAEESSPILDPDTRELFLGSGFPNQKLLAIDIDERVVNWEQELGQTSYASAALTDDYVYIASNNGSFYRVARSDQATVSFSASPEGKTVHSSPLLLDGMLYAVPGGTNLDIYAMDALTLAPNTDWSPDGSSSFDQGAWSQVVASSAATDGSAVFFAATYSSAGPTLQNVYVFRVDPADGSVIARDLGAATWSSFPAPPAAASDFIAVPAQETALLHILDTATLDDRQVLELDGPCVSAPALANAHLYAVTLTGTLWAFGDTNRPPTAPGAPFSPSNDENVTSSTPTLAWGASTDLDAPVSYTVRWDTDGEVLLDATEATTTDTAHTVPSIADGAQVAWAVRARDSRGAFSSWSELQEFSVNRSTTTAPDPPAWLSAAPRNTSVYLFWGESPSTDVDHYDVTFRMTGNLTYQPFSTVDGTSTTISGLTNWFAYDFLVVAVDHDGLISAAVTAQATPIPAIYLDANGILTEGFPDVASAVGVAATGDIVHLAAETFAVAATLDLPEGVVLEGEGAGLTILDASGTGGPALRVTDDAGTSQPAQIRMLTIRGSEQGIEVNGARAMIENNVLTGMEDGILLRGGARVSVANVTIALNNGAGIDAQMSEGTIKNCILQENGAYGIRADVVSAAALVLSYNNVVGSDLEKPGTPDAPVYKNYDGLSAGLESMSETVQFRDAFAGDFLVFEGEPTIDAGDPADDYSLEPYYNGGRINMGAFGNTPFAARSPVPAIPATPGGTTVTTGATIHTETSSGSSATDGASSTGGCFLRSVRRR